jgi:hypothetical protein
MNLGFLHGDLLASFLSLSFLPFSLIKCHQHPFRTASEPRRQRTRVGDRFSTREVVCLRLDRIYVPRLETYESVMIRTVSYCFGTVLQ